MKQHQYKIFENKILSVFNKCNSLTWNNIVYSEVKAFKPRPTKTPDNKSGGECRTDIYVSLRQNGKEVDCIKITAKLINSEFIVNKLKPNDAESLLGEGWSSIIREHIASIKNSFLMSDVIYKRAGDICFTLGWRLDVTKKSNRNLLVPITMSKKDIRHVVFRGCKQPDNRKNAKVGTKVINNSGIADYLLEEAKADFKDANSLIAGLDDLTTYNPPPIYFAFIASNYRIKANKVEGSRCLAVNVSWSVTNNKLNGKIECDKPLECMGGADVLPSLRQAMHVIGLNPTEFNEAKVKDFDINTIYIK